MKDIPEDVFAEADAVLREARAVDMKWRKLMGFPSADLARCRLEDRRPKP